MAKRTPEQQADRLVKILVSSESGFDKVVARYERDVNRLVRKELVDGAGKDLKVSKAGFIKPTVSNIKILNRVKRNVIRALLPVILNGEKSLEKALKKKGLPPETRRLFEGVEKVNVDLEKIEKEGNDWFNSLISDFTVAAGYEGITQATKDRVTIELGRNQVEQMLEGIAGILDSAISGSASRLDLIDQLKTFIQGDSETLGAYARYTSRYVRDTLNGFNGTYTIALANNIPLNDRFFYYSSGTVEDSRSFCVERNGRYFHYREPVEEWASEEWQGKHYNTTPGNIFTLRGGYNCLHQWIPVSVDIVPVEDLNRAIEKGYYTPPEGEEREAGLPEALEMLDARIEKYDKYLTRISRANSRLLLDGVPDDDPRVKQIDELFRFYTNLLGEARAERRFFTNNPIPQSAEDEATGRVRSYVAYLDAEERAFLAKVGVSLNPNANTVSGFVVQEDYTQDEIDKRGKEAEKLFTDYLDSTVTLEEAIPVPDVTEEEEEREARGERGLEEAKKIIEEDENREARQEAEREAEELLVQFHQRIKDGNALRALDSIKISLRFKERPRPKHVKTLRDYGISPPIGRFTVEFVDEKIKEIESKMSKETPRDLFEAQVAAKKKAKKLSDDVHKAIQKLFTGKKKQSPSLTIFKKGRSKYSKAKTELPKSQKKRAEKLFDVFLSIVGDRVKISQWLYEVSINNAKAFRAFHAGQTFSGKHYKSFVALSHSSSDDGTYLHEFFHSLEYIDPEFAQTIQDFYNERTREDTLKEIRKIKGYEYYDRGERTKEDEFLQPYIGKYYSERYGVRPTEIVTMFFSYLWGNTDENDLSMNIINLVEQDPDYFKFMYGLFGN